jgi:hypothetical protein
MIGVAVGCYPFLRKNMIIGIASRLAFGSFTAALAPVALGGVLRLVYLVLVAKWLHVLPGARH